MKYKKIEWKELTVEASFSSFSLPKGLSEYHAILRLTDAMSSAAEQYEHIEKAAGLLLEQLPGTEVVWKRYFVSDATNQQPYIPDKQGNTAVSIVQQPPLNGTKVALWLYLIPKGFTSKNAQNNTVIHHPPYTHLFSTQLHVAGKDETEQTTLLFKHYIDQLAAEGCTLAQNCMRTWVYVQGIDRHYSGMVAARKACFEQEHLTPATHFITSTGIEGKYIHSDILTFMDAYAVKGLQPEQIRYLHAPTHLNPTHEYGVTFERATAIQYGDRKHVFISGTASINNKGQIVHPMDIVKQTDRMFENILTLLHEAEATAEDIAQMIVYIRDIADYQTVHNHISNSCPQIPAVIVLAPVCRPGWLIETECMAITATKDSRFADF